MDFFKYTNKESTFAVETDGESIFSIKLIPTSTQVYSKNYPKIITELFLQLDEYFNRERQGFDINYTLIGTEFQLKVWNELLNIPYGKTISYSEMAKRIGKPKASRAVGGALNKNPIPIIVPCQRVIGKDGSLTGFGGGIELKNRMLKTEGIKQCYKTY